MVRDEEMDSDLESSGQERPLDWPMVASAKNVESFIIVCEVDRWTVVSFRKLYGRLWRWDTKLWIMCEQSRASVANL